MLEYLQGKKTYAVGAALLAYLFIQSFITRDAVDQNIVNAMLAAMGLTIRAGIRKGE
jgi:hypothetical protein